MNGTNPAWPLDTPEHLAAALREQGAAEAEIAGTAAALLPLADWPAPAPTPEETRRLIARLVPLVPPPAPAVSPTRQALLARPAGLAGELWLMLRLVRAQVSILTAPFWLASLVVAGLGGLLVWAAPSLSRSFLLHVIGPLLAYIGTANAFRASGLKMLEFELACPPSPRQLTLARLTVVLSYDLMLGLLLSALLWPNSSTGFWLLTQSWLAPLLLGIGLTLLLSLRTTVAQAATVTYLGWLVLLMLSLINGNGVQGAASTFSPTLEWGLGLAGLVMIAIALAALPRALADMLPRRSG